ncbi:MAG: PxKF domain-containing protein [Steroidobacteraceae bacterium]
MLLFAMGSVSSHIVLASGVVAVGGIQDARTEVKSFEFNLDNSIGPHAFLSNGLIEVGSRANGSCGATRPRNENETFTSDSDYSPPTGYHQRPDYFISFGAPYYSPPQGLGFRAVNPVDKDWTANTFGDFFIPGDPFEGFAVGVGSANYWNTDLLTQITGGTWGSASYTPGTGATATWSGGTAGDILVTQVASIPESGYLLHVDVTLKNTSASSVGPVYYYRGLDPDNCQANTGTVCQSRYFTRNAIEYSNDAALGSRVSSSQEDGSYLALLSPEPDSKVITGNFGFFCNGEVDEIESVSQLWDGTNPCVLPAENLSDIGGYQGVFGDFDYGIVINLGTLAAGQEKSVRVTYMMVSPPPPGTISGTPGNGEVALTWTVPTSKFEPATGYLLQYSTSAEGPWIEGTGGCAASTTGVSTALTCTQLGLTNGTNYFFRVAGVNAYGRGLYTDPAEATPTAPTVSCDGFFAPVDRRPTTNQANAGRVIPLKWRCTNEGVPVTSIPDEFRVSTTACLNGAGSASTLDAIEEYAPGSSGLINQGNGYWQFNWATPKSYANSCKAVTVTFDGAQIGADFTFKR